MTKRWLALLAGVAMIVGLGVTVDPAGASPERPEVTEAPSHNPQGSHWAWVCLAGRPSEAPTDVEHAHVYLMDANHVRVYCEVDTASGLQECAYHAIEWAGGQVTGPHGLTPYCGLNTDGATSGLQMFRSAPAKAAKPAHPFPPADHFNNLSALTCAASHPSPPALSSWYIQYSNPYYYDANHIRYTCIGHYHVDDVGILCVWTGIYWTGGTITGPYYTSPDPCTFF